MLDSQTQHAIIHVLTKSRWVRLPLVTRVHGIREYRVASLCLAFTTMTHQPGIMRSVDDFDATPGITLTAARAAALAS